MKKLYNKERFIMFNENAKLKEVQKEVAKELIGGITFVFAVFGMIALAGRILWIW